MKGIYAIKNLTNQRLYIGRSNRLEAMKDMNFDDLIDGTHCSEELQKDFDESNITNFQFTILDVITNPYATLDDLHNLQDRAIRKALEDKIDLCYTITLEVEEEIQPEKKRRSRTPEEIAAHVERSKGKRRHTGTHCAPPVYRRHKDKK